MHVQSLCLILMLLTFSWLCGQDRAFQNYSIADGLPSNEVHCIVQAPDGAMWFGTDAGLVRFNGSDFQVFDELDGLPNEVILQMTIDRLGRLWVATIGNKVCYFENGRFIERRVKTPVSKYEMYISGMDVDDDMNVLLTIHHCGFLVVAENTDTTWVNLVPEKQGFVTGGILFDGDTVFSTGYRPPKNIRQKWEEEIPLDFYFKLYSQQGDLLVDRKFSHLVSPPVAGNRMNAVSIGNTVLAGQPGYEIRSFAMLKPNMKYLSLPVELTHITRLKLIESNGKLILATWGAGYFECSVVGDSLVILDNQLRTTGVTNHYIDSQGGTWVSTLNSGVYYSKPQAAYVVPCPIASKWPRIRSISSYGNDVFVLAKNSEILNPFTGDGLTGPFPGYVSDFAFFSNGNLVLEISPTYVILDRSTASEERRLEFGSDQLGKVSAIRKLEENLIIAMGAYGYAVISDSSREEFVNREERFVYQDVVHHQGSLLFASAKGLVRQFAGKARIVGFDGESIVRLWKWKNTLVVSTESNGVFLCTSSDTVKVQFEEYQRFGSTTAFTTLGDDLFFGNKAGLFKCSEDKPHQAVQVPINSEATLSINDLLSHEDRLFVSTKSGLFILDKQALESGSSKLLGVYWDGLCTSQDTCYNELDDVELRSKDFPVVLSFSAIGFSEPHKIKYAYRLNENEDWRETSADQVEFSDLPIGPMKIQLRAQYAGGQWSSPIELNGEVIPKFYRSPFFVLMILFFIALLGFEVARILQKRKQTKDQIKERIKDLQAMALRAQMNPHFIFNALNSMQAFVTSGDIENSNKYLTTMAGLIREVLDNSTKKYIPISAELKMLEAYLGIESMRFMGQLSYEFRVHESVDTSARIPPMLIQPYVENAIKHGLQDGKRKGQVEVSMRMENGSLLCSVRDNGIGIDKARELIMNDGSKGMDLTKQRLSLYSSSSLVQVKDVSRHESETGTLVELVIETQDEE